jgi:alpha-tubulin suppressor-like RCC1 family protein
MKSIFLFLILVLSGISFGQCWQSLDFDGDTNSVHYAIQNDGTLWQLPTIGSPVQIGNQTIWKKCFTSFSYSSSVNTVHLIANDSTLWGFGNNYDGQLGNNIDFEQIEIIQLNPYKWIDLAAGDGGVYGIRSDGSLWKWGSSQFTPIQIGNQYNWKKISANYGEFVAIKNDGSIWSGNFTSTPVQVGNQLDWNYVWYNWFGWYSIKTNGTLWFKQYGNSNVMQIGSDADWKMINGENDLFAIKTNGTLWYWSSNWDVFNIYPEQLISTTFKDVSSGVYDFIYAIAENGELYKGNVTWDNSIPNLFKDTSANPNCQSAETIKIEENYFLLVSPNPTSDKISIKINDTFIKQKYFIYDQFGRIILESTFEANKNQVDLSEFHSGIYFLKVEGDKGTIKIVKN